MIKRIYDYILDASISGSRAAKYNTTSTYVKITQKSLVIILILLNKVSSAGYPGGKTVFESYWQQFFLDTFLFQ